MTQQLIGIGSSANDGTGDDLRTAAGKINANFTELYAASQTGLNVTTFSVVPRGYTGSTVVGRNRDAPTLVSATAGQLVNTNESTRRKHVRFFTGAVANTQAGYHAGANSFAVGYLGDAAGRGGFSVTWRFALITIPASSYRFFLGLMTSGSLPASPTGDYSAYTNIIGLGKDTADASWQIMHNDGSGSATKIPISTSDIPITAGTAIEFTLSCPPGDGQDISYEVKTITGIDSASNDTYGTPVTGTLTAGVDLPAELTPLLDHGWLNNAGLASDHRWGLMKVVGTTWGD